MTFYSKVPGFMPPDWNLIKIFDPVTWLAVGCTTLTFGISIWLLVRFAAWATSVNDEGHFPDCFSLITSPLAMLGAEAMPSWFDRPGR